MPQSGDPVLSARTTEGDGPRRTTSVAGQTFLILGARVIGAVSTGVLTIVLARLLGLEGYGDYALALTIATLAAMFASLGVDSATSRYVADGFNSGRGISGVIMKGLKLRTVVAGAVFGALFVAAEPLASLFGEAELAGAVRAAAIALFFSAGFSWASGVYEGVQQGRMLAVMSIVKAIVEFAVVLALLLAGFGVVGALLGNALSYALAVAVGIWVMRPHMRRRRTLPEAEVSSSAILRYGNHIWLAGVAWLLFDRVDIVLLGAFIDTDAVGLYDAPWRIATILGLLGLSLASSVTPRIASVDPAAAGRLLTKALRVTLIFYVVLGVITAVAAHDLIVTLLGAEFARSATVLQVLLPYLVLIGMAPILSRALDYLGVAAVRKWIALSAFLVNLVLDLILIPTVGLLGAAIGTNFAIFGFVAGHYVLVARRLPIDEKALTATLLRAAGAAVAAGVACWLALALPVPALVRLAIAFPVAIGVAIAVLVALGETRTDTFQMPPQVRRFMDRMIPRTPQQRAGMASTDVLLPIAAAMAALVIGLGVGRSPFIVIGAMIGLALIALLLSDITVGVVAFVLIQPLALLIGAGESLVSKGAGVILLVTWVVSLRYPSTRRRYQGFISHHPLLVALIIAFMGWCIASMLWSINVSYSIDAIGRYALGFVLLGIVFTAVRDRRAAILVCGAFCLSAALSTTIGLVTNNTIDGRLVGTFADANEFAAFLVPALLIGAALASTAITPLRRMAFGLASLICALGIVLSGSRGGIVAIGAALLVWTIFGGRWRLRVLTASVAVIIVLVGYVNIAASPATQTRIATITQGESFGSSAGTGRADIWRVGLRAYHDHPTKGSGIGTFTAATPRYLARPGLVRRTDFFTETPKVAHNTYLHLLVEVGTVGLVLFGGILLACLVAVARAAHLFKRAGDAKLELLSRTLLAGTVGILVADFFISGQYQRILWILLGLCVAMLGIARGARAPVRSAEATDPPDPPSWIRHEDRTPAGVA